MVAHIQRSPSVGIRPRAVVSRMILNRSTFETGPRATATARHHAGRTPLRLVESPPHGSSAVGVPVAGIAVAVAVVFILLAVLRLTQGGPPAGNWAELTIDSRVSAPALAGPGDLTRIARQGDTFWAIAIELAPERDPRPIVDLLVSVNGGEVIEVGQRLVIPAELVGGTRP